MCDLSNERRMSLAGSLSAPRRQCRPLPVGSKGVEQDRGRLPSYSAGRKKNRPGCCFWQFISYRRRCFEARIDIASRMDTPVGHPRLRRPSAHFSRRSPWCSRGIRAQAVSRRALQMAPIIRRSSCRIHRECPSLRGDPCAAPAGQAGKRLPQGRSKREFRRLAGRKSCSEDDSFAD